MIAGRIKMLDQSPFRISHETIYQFVYSPIGASLELFKLLCKRRPRRGQKNGRIPRCRGIPDRVSIHDRPAIIELREEFGHFEGDLTFLKGNQSGNIGVMIERKSRFGILAKNTSKESNMVLKGVFNALAGLPIQSRKSITFDNGKEFTKHIVLKNYLSMQTYFCDKHSPWQKGQVENFNALLHRYIPKNTFFTSITDQLLERVQNEINNRPRKCLGFKTPMEVFQENLCQGVAFQA